MMAKSVTVTGTTMMATPPLVGVLAVVAAVVAAAAMGLVSTMTMMLVLATFQQLGQCRAEPRRP
jgi:hypothetical protein